MFLKLVKTYKKKKRKTIPENFNWQEIPFNVVMVVTV